jgi:hypothetical protein
MDRQHLIPLSSPLENSHGINIKRKTALKDPNFHWNLNFLNNYLSMLLILRAALYLQHPGMKEDNVS